MQVTHLSRLYESAPAYVTDQPTFINGALAATTQHEPFKLLDTLKEIEVRAQQLVTAELPLVPTARYAEEVTKCSAAQCQGTCLHDCPAFRPGCIDPRASQQAQLSFKEHRSCCSMQGQCRLWTWWPQAAVCRLLLALQAAREPMMCSPAH